MGTKAAAAAEEARFLGSSPLVSYRERELVVCAQGPCMPVSSSPGVITIIAQHRRACARTSAKVRDSKECLQAVWRAARSARVGLSKVHRSGKVRARALSLALSVFRPDHSENG